MRRRIHLTGSVRMARRPVRATIHRDAGIVEFREWKRRTTYVIGLDQWIGLGFDRAVAVAAAEQRQARKDARKAARKVNPMRTRTVDRRRA